MDQRLTRTEHTRRATRPDAIIRTKLYVPRAQASWVSRPRLIEKLDQIRERSVTLLAAPAGFGKTTLLGDWIHTKDEDGRREGDISPFTLHPAPFQQRPLNVAWLTLDERDNNLVRFLIYLVAALKTLEIQVDECFWEQLHTLSPSPEEVLAELVNRITEVPDDFALVLDDCHLVTSLPVKAALNFLVEHLPPQMHLVFASRVEPSLPLSRLRARGQLLELRAADLRFTVEESFEFLNRKMGLDLPLETVIALENSTEGWIAGLQLAAIAFQASRAQHSAASLPASKPERLSDFLQTFNGSHRYVVDFLAEQVLLQQPLGLQSFLLDTSILERLSAAACEALFEGEEPGLAEVPSDQAMEDLEEPGSCRSLLSQPLPSRGQAILEHLERANLFLAPLDDERRWYRYHPLFASFLRERLRRTRPERWAELHRRAAEWCERNGLIAEAVDHALALGDSGQAVRLVERIAEAIWKRGEMARLWGWLKALPDEVIRSRPRLCIFHAWLLNIKGEFKAREERLRDVQARLSEDEPGDPQERRLIQGMLAAMQGIVAGMEGEPAAAFDFCREALECLPAENPDWRCVVYRNLGNAYLLDGQTALARQAFCQAYELSQRAGNTYMALISLYEMGELDLVLGQLRRAAGLFQAGLQLAAEHGAPGLTITGALHVGLSEVLRQWNHLEAGVQHARAGIELGFQDGSLGVRITGLARLAMLARALGDGAAATRALEKAMQLAPGLKRTAFIAHQEAQARLWGEWVNPPPTAGFFAPGWNDRSSLQARQAAFDRWEKETGISLEDAPTCLNEAGSIVLARLLLSSGRLEQAAGLLARLRQAAEAAGRTGRLVEILALQALAWQARGKTDEALGVLEECLALAGPEGYVRVFLDEGERMRALLAAAAARLKDAKVLEYVRSLLAAFDGGGRSGVGGVDFSRPASGQHASLVEPLSERELDVLRLMAAGLTNQEIASRLVVAASTVHWHTKNIYGKLSVHSRTQAVCKARQLGLVR